MAANFIMQSSLVQPKPSLSAKTLQNPSLSPLSRLSPPSSLSFFSIFFGFSLFGFAEYQRKVLFFAGVCFLPKNGSGIVGKASLASAVADSTSSVLENKNSSKNPIIVIDNYDSFTYNLCQYMGELGCHFEVYRNDELTVEELKRNTPRFWNIIANSFGTWTYCTFVWCLHGFAVHWRGFWRKGSAFSLWCYAWQKFSCVL
ncbi:hypothetical protein REPUB_Repub01dG0046200 [Reevesia pubescens]